MVEAVGSDTSLFKPGDEVYYSGSIARQGTDAEFHVVDERIVGRKPASLTFPQAAAMPLTTITAWELLFQAEHCLSSMARAALAPFSFSLRAN